MRGLVGLRPYIRRLCCIWELQALSLTSSSFSSVLTGVSIGYAVHKLPYFRRIKAVIIVGTLLYFIATAIHVHFPGKSTSSDHSGIIGSQVLLGVGITRPCLLVFLFTSSFTKKS